MKNPLKYLLPTLPVFYVLGFYIFASLIWWSFLHWRNNDRDFEQKFSIMRLSAELEGLNPADIVEYSAYEKLVEKRDRQRWMIAGEGAFFLLILLVGAYQVLTGLRKEIIVNQQQRNFLLSITHELKSPLAGIKLTTETLLKRKLSEEQSQEFLSNSLQETDRLASLVDNLLMAAKLDGESFSLVEQNLDLCKIVNEILYPYLQQYREHRIWSVSVEGEALVKADRTAMLTIVSNLIDNAIKYSSEGDQIVVSCKENGNEVLFKVADSGVGIAKEEQTKVFKKFYRVGNEDTRETKGTGLGLFLVNELVQIHNGTIKLSSAAIGGAEFSVVLPKVKLD